MKLFLKNCLSIWLFISVIRLVNVAAVLKSIPSPSPENVSVELAATVATEVEMSARPHCDESALEHLENVFKIVANEEEHLVQATELLLRFEFQEIRLSLSVSQNDLDTKPLLNFAMGNLAMVCAKKTFETVVDLTLKDLNLSFIDHAATNGQHHCVKMINSCEASKELLSVHFIDVDKQSPEFYIRHKSVKRKLEVVISSLVCDFHQEAVIDLLQLINDINSRIDKVLSAQPTRYLNTTELENSTKTQPAKALVAEGK